MNSEELAHQVRHRRRQLQISQSKLAELAGISRNYVSLIERGEVKNASIGVLEALGAALGLTAGQLTGENQSDPIFIPPALRQLALKQKMQFETVERLVRIPKRGKEPHTPEEWGELYQAVRPYLE